MASLRKKKSKIVTIVKQNLIKINHPVLDRTTKKKMDYQRQSTLRTR